MGIKDEMRAKAEQAKQMLGHQSDDEAGQQNDADLDDVQDKLDNAQNDRG